MLFLLAACLNSTVADEPDGGACVNKPEGAFALRPRGPSTQIHVASVFDGQALWLTWVEVHEQQLQIWAGRYACDGSALVAPFRVDNEPFDALDPAIAIGGGRMLLSWHRDNRSTEQNLAVFTAVLDPADGSVLSSPTELVVQRQGGGGVQNFWMTSVAATPQGFLLAGAAGIDGNFRVVLVELDDDGAPAGPVIEPLLDASITQTAPSLATDAEGRAHLAFDGNVQEEVWYSFDGGPAQFIGEGALPVVASNGLLVFPSSTGTWAGPTSAPQSIGVDGGLNAIVASGVGGFVGWHRNISGFANQIKVARIDGQGNIGPRKHVGTETGAPYGWNLTPIDDEWVFVAFQQGISPDFQLYGRFLRFEE